MECAKYDGDALLRECFNWQESRYVRDMPITGTSPCNLFGGGDVKSTTEGSAERGVAGAQKTKLPGRQIRSEDPARVLNLNTAKALGVEVPLSLIALAEEVIE